MQKRNWFRYYSLCTLFSSFGISFLGISTSAGISKSVSAAVHPDKIHVQLVPFHIDGKLNYEQFLNKIKNEVTKAKAAKADLVVFPELFMADMVEAAELKSPLKTQMREFAKLHTPQLMLDLKSLAKENRIYLLGGSFPRQVNNDIHNTSIFISPNGETHLQDKIYLTPDEKDWGWAGGKKIEVFDTEIGKIAILICYDVEFPQISDRLASLAPEIIIVPSMTDTEAGFRRVRWTSQARAVEHRAYVLHVGTTGAPDPSWPHYAQASALSPSEKGFSGLIAEGGVNSSEPLLVELNLAKLREARKSGGIHPAKDQTDRKKSIQVKGPIAL
jgi:predicted amidohydrolase